MIKARYVASEGEIMISFIYTIVTGVLATILYEMLKEIFIIIKAKCDERTSTFNINGYWTSLHKSVDSLDGKEYTSFELVKLKNKKGIVFIKIYQIISDDRRYVYRGNGLIRFDKLVFSYEEITKNKSNFLGSIMLRFSNEIEHQVVLQGRYYEFRKNSPNSRSYPYILREYKLSNREKINFFLKGEKYIFKILEKDEFKDECRKKV